MAWDPEADLEMVGQPLLGAGGVANGYECG